MLHDLRYAYRALLRAPGFTAVAAMTLALGIGANTAIFSVISGILLKPLPFRDPDRLARLNEGRPGFELNVSYPNFIDWRQRSRTFEDMAVYNPYGRSIVTYRGRSEAVSSGSAEARLFPLLGVRPFRGRLFAPEEQKPGSRGVVLLSHSVWLRLFGGADSIVGQEIAFAGTNATVVGVLPPEFRLPRIDVWYPFVSELLTAMQLDRGNHPGFQVFARLREGVTFDQAQREMSSIAADLEQQHPTTNHQMGVFVRPVLDTVIGGVRPMLLSLGAAVGFLLLIACANVANVLLARGLRRGRETSIRAALGAGRWRLARLFLIESIVIAAIGGVAGLLLAAWGVRTLQAITWFTLPRASDITIDTRVLAFAVLLSALTSVVFGLAPAIQLSRIDLIGGLRQAGGPTGGGSRRLRATLVAVEVSLSLVLAAGAGLMLRTLAQLADVNPGFRPDGLVAINTQQPQQRYRDPDARALFAERLAAELTSAPGVAAAAIAWPLDMVSFSWSPYANFRDQPFPPGQAPAVQMAAVSPTFFETMGIPLRRGRFFRSQDRPGAPVAVIVNETVVRRFLPDGDPIGRKMSLVGIPELEDAEIVGVVGDTLRGNLAGRLVPEVYCAYAQFSSSGPTVVVRATSGDPFQLVRTVEERIATIDSGVATYGSRRLSDVLVTGIGDRRMLAMLLGLFGALALALTGLGIAGVVAYIVAQRTQEIGVRMALGADARSVLTLVIKGAMTPVIVGLVAGLAVAVPFTRLLRAYLFQVSPVDPLALTSGIFVLLTSTLVAAYIPARRATRIDPLSALRVQ
jgi:putative ABC transport system permease protein